ELLRRRGRELDGGALRREAAGEDRDRLLGPDRAVERTDHLVVGVGGPALDDLPERLAADGRRREIEMIAQPPPQRRQAAAGMEVLHEEVAGRLEIEEHRHVAADTVELGEIEG